MKTKIFFIILITVVFTRCDERAHIPHANRYPNDVAVAWINLQQKLNKTTPGYSPGVSGRAFAYSGLALYESIVQGMPRYRSIMPYVNGPDVSSIACEKSFHWPSSANAAMALMIRNLYESTNAANKHAIDSLEAFFNQQFTMETNANIVQLSGDYGRKVSASIFEWSKTDGGHEGYKPQPPTYVPPTGAGLWVPTPPAMAPAAAPFSGNFRTFIPGIADATQPSKYPLPAYDETVGSPFYNMVNESYTISQSLTPAQISIVKYWGDIPGNYNGPSHFTNIATQLIVLKNLKLDEAAAVYAKHGIALNDAGISCFKTKYKYNLVRPITYIRGVMHYTTWNTVIPTPPHPEFSSAHAVIGKASSVALESFFGKKCSFIDRTHESLYGARTYATLSAYAEEGGWSRVLGGLHYHQTADYSLVYGKQIGDIVNTLAITGARND